MVALPAFILARHLIFGDRIGLPSAIAIATAMGFFVLSLHRIMDVAKLRGEATVAADSINQYLLRVPSVSQVVGAKFLEPMSRLLQFDQVCMETETHPELLTNLDLKNRIRRTDNSAVAGMPRSRSPGQPDSSIQRSDKRTGSD